jgi:hypothetical protein
MSQVQRTMSDAARADVHPDSRLRGFRPRGPIRTGWPDVERSRLLRVAQRSGVALLTAVALGLAVAPAAPSHVEGERSAAELWQAYPLNPDASDAGAGGARRDGAATGAGGDLAVRYMGDESDGAVDSRLMLQLGMLIAAFYAAFLCVWFTASRGTLGFGAGPDVSGGVRCVRAWTAAVATARPRTEHRFVARAANSSRADADAVWTCAIGWGPGRVRSRFRAMMAPPDGRGWRIVAQSRSLRWPPRRGEALPTAELVSALESLVAALVAAGWEPVEPGGSWSARRFVWRRDGEPPARLRLAGEE